MNMSHAVGIGFALVAGASSVLASEDSMMFPGASCQPSSTTQRISRNATGAMFNESDGDNQSWICPIARDTYGATSIEYAQVTVLDRSSRSNVSCTLYSRTAAGNQVASATRTTNGNSNESVTLRFGDGPANAVSSAPGGYFYFDCRIPRSDDGDNSGVISYRVTENVGED